MSRTITRIAAGATAALVAALAMTVPGSPAAADDPVADPSNGLVFYSIHPQAVVGFQATPDDVCRPVPAKAVWAIAYSNTDFRGVAGYRTADCTGPAANLNSFHSWPEGWYLSYRAPAFLVDF